jgi:hypothetical protein
MGHSITGFTKEGDSMGVQTRLLGYIEEAWPGLAAGGDPALMQHLVDTDHQISRHNDGVLKSLPEADDWPPLCRPMFGWAPADTPLIVYKNRLIHLAASLKELDWEFREWLDKFEAVLRQLYWESAYVRFEGAYIGVHEFKWRPTEAWMNELRRGRLAPITEWSFNSTLPADDLVRLSKYSQIQ